MRFESIIGDMTKGAAAGTNQTVKTYWSKLSDLELVGKFLKCTKDVDGLDAECMYGDIVPVYSLNTLREWYGHNLEHKTPLSLEHTNIKLPDEIFFMKEYFIRDIFNFCCCGLGNGVDCTLSKLFMCFLPIDSDENELNREDVSLCYNRDAFIDLFGEGEDYFEDFLLHYLCAMDLTDHGTSIYGSWINYSNGTAYVMKEVFARWYEKEYLDDGRDDNKT